MNVIVFFLNLVLVIFWCIMLIVFVFCFFGLFVDGVDLMFLVYSFNSLKVEFGLSNFEVGFFGSLIFVGMVVGGIYGGWCCDCFGWV